MSTAERLAEALEAVLAAVRFSNQPPDTVMAAEAKLDAVRKAGEQAREALAAYRSTPADGGGQGVTPLTDAQIASAWRQWPRQSITSAAKAIEFMRWCGIGTPASTGGSDA